MSFSKQRKESRRWKRIWVGFQALIHRLRRLPLWFKKSGKRILTSYLFPSVIGVLLFAWFSQWFFGVTLWPSSLDFRSLSTPMLWWGFVLYLSIVVGGWSVGGALWHVVVLSLKWTLLYST